MDMDMDMDNKNNYFKYLESEIKEKCIINDYKKAYIAKHSVIYPKNNSNTQIKFIVDTTFKKRYITYYNNFLLLLTNFISFYDAFKLLNTIRYTNNITDIDILKNIDKLHSKKDSIFSLEESCSKQEFGMEMIKSNMELHKIKIKKNSVYLDIGCGDGKKTDIFASAFDIAKKNINGTDINTWGPYSNDKKFSFKFKEIINGKLDYNDKTFDIITIFLTLHHIENIDLMLNEIYRILKKNGTLIIIEHDSINYLDNLIIEIQHTFFAYFYDKNKNIINNQMYSNYYSSMELEYIFKNHNFKPLIKDNLYQTIGMQRRYDNQYYQIFRKI